MQIIESARIALRSLGANKLRSGLTMLGVIIGVAAVISLMSIGQGAQAAITAQIQGIGTNLLFVRPGAMQESGVRGAQGSAVTLTMQDAEALASAPGVVMVAPQFNAFGQAVAQGQNVRTQIIGVTPAYQQVRNTYVQSGDFISDAHVTARSSVAVLGSNVAATLFPGGEPIGQNVRINNVTFRVIGVLETKGGTGFGNQDDLVLVPLTTAQSRLFGGDRFRGQTSLSLVNVQVAEASQIEQAIQDISAILRERHRVIFEDDFTVQSQQDILNTATQITGVLTIFLGGIAAISLIVGGIGIMNIMLVSVTERTREIGIRKALGARRHDILAQFLTEATILSLVGGIIGILIGAGVARLVSGISFGTATIATVVNLDSILLATIFSMAVGLFFGIYPASRAAGLNPIEALRYE